MAIDPNEDYYSGDFGEQINRSNAMDDEDDMKSDDNTSTEDSARPMPSSNEAETAFQERLSTERSDRDHSSSESEMDAPDMTREDDTR